MPALLTTAPSANTLSAPTSTASAWATNRPPWASVMQVVDKLLVLREGRVQQFGPRGEIAGMITPGGRVEIEPAGKAPTAPAPVREVKA